jgi:hypothetical protein
MAKRITADEEEPMRLAARDKRSRVFSSSRTGTGFVLGVLPIGFERNHIPTVYKSKRNLAEFSKSYTNPAVAESKPIPVRLGEDLIKRLDQAAERIGSNRAAVIRMLITQWLDEFERRGVIHLPPNWPEIMQGLDARTKKSQVTERQTGPAVKAPPLPAKSEGRRSHQVSKTRPPGDKARNID